MLGKIHLTLSIVYSTHTLTKVVRIVLYEPHTCTLTKTSRTEVYVYPSTYVTCIKL